MENLVRIGDCADISIRTGIMSTRIVADAGDEIVDTKFIIRPADFNEEGFSPLIHNKKFTHESNLKVQVKPDKLTKEGDLIIKLCGPYDCTIIDKESAGLVVSSFCATISCTEAIDKYYLLTAMNSGYVRYQIKEQIPGRQVSTAISVNIIKNVFIPLPDMETQKELGKKYQEAHEELRRIKAELNKARREYENTVLSYFDPYTHQLMAVNKPLRTPKEDSQ